jgi:hypothetical protein
MITHESFEKSGLILYGPRWKAPMGRALGVTRETVSRWHSRKDVPTWACNTVGHLIERKGSVLSLCDRTTNMVRPWAEAGFECFCVDHQHPEGEHREGNIVTIGADIRTFRPPPRRYAIVFASPPCTNLAVSGARHMRAKGLPGLAEGAELVDACIRICEWSQAPWMLENPVSTLASYWRKPDFTFNPLDFGGYAGGEGDGYTKKTCLWTDNNFRFPGKKPIPELRPLYIHNMARSSDRGDRRSVTPMGFARAVFEANVGRFDPAFATRLRD